MLRKLREQWWYMLLWLPLCTALIFLALWLLIVFRIIGIWTIQYDAAPKWGFLSIGVFALFLLVLFVLFPRKPARGLLVATTSACLVAALCCILFYANTRVVTYVVSDVDGGPLEGIPIQITHHANAVAFTWFPGEVLLRTNEEGKAAVRIFRSEECAAYVNDLLGKAPGYGNSRYSEDNVFLASISAQQQMGGLPLGDSEVLGHSYMLEFQNGLPYISQRCLEPLPHSSQRVVHVYLRRRDSLTLPPYFHQIIGQKTDDPNFKRAQLMSLGGSIESFNYIDDLLSAVSKDDALQDAALFSADLLAIQIREITSNLSGLSLDVNVPQSRYRSTNAQRQECSQLLYIWLSGNSAPPHLSHPDRIAYIKQRMDDATAKLIDALHPAMLKKKLAYGILEDLQQGARPAMKFYPEVFDKGTDEAKEGALEVIGPIAPSAQDIAFLLRSKKPTWIECASRIFMNSTAAELSDDLKTLEGLKSQESDAQNIAAFDKTIKLVGDQLTRDQSEEANKPSSSVEPRYVVIDLGTQMVHPKQITNSGYVLGDNSNSYYVWFDGTESVLKPKYVGDTLTVDSIDEDGTVVGTERGPGSSGSLHSTITRAVWEKGANPPKLTAESQAKADGIKAAIQTPIPAMNLPQIASLPVTPKATNAGMALLRPPSDSPDQIIHLVPATQVIGNGPGGGYLWEMTPTLSTTKTFEGPFLINSLLPGEPKVSPWTVNSVDSINDGGTILGTAIYKPTGANDPTAAGLHAVMLMPLAIVREAPPGSGDFEPIADNGLDDNATIPIFRSAPPGTPNASTPETDGQGIFYIQMPGSIPSSITLKSGNNKVTVQATPVSGRPNMLRTGKLVLIEHGDPFKAPDITTIDAGAPNDGGSPTLELQKYDRTVVK